MHYESMERVSALHPGLNTCLIPPFPDAAGVVVFGMGCFWGAERKFWSLEGIYTTAVGYAGGFTDDPDYRQVCAGRTGHAEVVLVVFDQLRVDLGSLFKTFWESHDPTQGMRQGNDRGEQYRSIILTTTPEQKVSATQSLQAYQQALNTHSGGQRITTQIQTAVTFYYAEDYHQQYLLKNPNGYCGLGGTGVCYPQVV